MSTTTPIELIELAAAEYVALRTFRRDGTATVTPIWIAPGDDVLLAYTPVRSYKVSRLCRDPTVEVAPSDFHGRPLGPWRRGRANVLPASSLGMVRQAMMAKYGSAFRWFTVVTLLGRPRRHAGRAVGLAISICDGQRGAAAAAGVR